MPEIPWPKLDTLDLLGRVKALGAPHTVIDWGCGLNHSPISCQVKELACELLLSIDAWPPYTSAAIAGEYKARSHRVITEDIRDAADHLAEEGFRTDLSLCLDIVEHLLPEEAIAWLEVVEKLSRAILIWIPLGEAPITHDTYGGENHFYHTHRSTWTREDLEALGYACDVIVDMHTPMFGHRVDGCWAVKVVKGNAGQADISR